MKSLQLGGGEGNPPPSDEMAVIVRFFHSEAYIADVAALRRMHPELLTLELHLREGA